MSDIFIVDTSEMDDQEVIPLVHDGSTYLMSKLSINEEDNTSTLNFRWTPYLNWWEVRCMEDILLYNIFLRIF